MVNISSLVALVALTFSQVHGLSLDVTSPDSIKAAAATIASNVVSYYSIKEGQAVGVLDPPYEWWEAGVLFDSLIQYWQLTGDDQYNDLVVQGLGAQVGQNKDFMPANQSKSEGNDDQGIWALAAMSAAEAQLPTSSGPAWIELAEAVFNDQVARWDDGTCGGGLRWQIYSFNSGYTFKNSIANGLFFQLAARLARYTGNSTYSAWAGKSFNWTTSVGFIDSMGDVYDGASIQANCTSIDKLAFSYTAGAYIGGLAYMYNITTGQDQVFWQSNLNLVLSRNLAVFFPAQDNSIATEISCEPIGTCSSDMFFFKGLLGHWLVNAFQMASTVSTRSILPVFHSNSIAAASACTLGSSGNECPFAWNSTSPHGSTVDLGSELNALVYVQGLLADQAAAPATATTSGGNGTGTGTGTGTAGSAGTATTSGSPAPSSSPSSSKSAGVAHASEHAGFSILAGMFSLMAWFIL